MQWLPPNFRCVYSQELPEKILKETTDVLNSRVVECGLFISYPKNGRDDFIALCHGVEIRGNKLMFYISELQPNTFLELNLHYKNFGVKLDIEDLSIIRMERFE